MSKNSQTPHPSLLDTIKDTVLVPLHPAGVPFVIGFAFAAFFSFLVTPVLGWGLTVLTLFCVYFFRDPVRVVPQRAGLVVAPADGKIIAITPSCTLPKDIAPEGAMEDFTRVSIFLSVFDAHVNRVPIAGQIEKLAYHPGKFVNAALDKASEDNERASALIKLEDGRYSAVVQIAGFVARRIITTLKDGQHAETGQKYGIIRFGSRADIYLPKGVAPLVCVGQRAVGGETVLADLTSDEPQREGRAA